MIPAERAEVVIRENNIEYEKFPEITPRIFRYWKKQRDAVKHPIMRCFWKSSSTKDEALTLIFASANQNKMSLRRSRNSQTDLYKKLKKLKKGTQLVLEIVEAIKFREQIKRYTIASKAHKFDIALGQENGTVLDDSLVGQSSALRKRQSVIARPPEIDQPVITQYIQKIVSPPPVVKPKGIAFDLAAALCAIVNNNKELTATWPLVDQFSRRRMQNQLRDESSALDTTNIEFEAEPVVAAKPWYRKRLRRGLGFTIERIPESAEGMYINQARFPRFITSAGNFVYPFAQQANNEDIDDENDIIGFKRLRKAIGMHFKAFKQRRIS